MMVSSQKRRRRWLLTALACLLLLPFVRYRLPCGWPVEFPAEIQYQYVDLGQGDGIRSFFELPFGNRRLFLVDHSWVFVSESDFNRCWPVPDMREAGYTIQATIKTNPLLFGGYGVAQVVSVERLDKMPVVSK